MIIFKTYNCANNINIMMSYFIMWFVYSFFIAFVGKAWRDYLVARYPIGTMTMSTTTFSIATLSIMTVRIMLEFCFAMLFMLSVIN
jgi:hypothetical protein